MSTKRQATTNLNHDNWDREEEPEERGSFREAPEDELSKRVIKKARRQITGNTVGAADAAGGGASKSVFSGFAGFGKTSTNSGSSQGAAASSPFSFLAKLPNAAASTSSSSTTTNKPTFSFGGASTTSTPTSVDVSKLDKKSTESSDKSTTYYAKLKGLNQAVTDWIKTHVDKNPLCILTPIFKDYEKYLKEIEEEEKLGTTATAESSNALKAPDVAASTATSSTTFGNFKFSSAPTSIASTALTSTSEAKSTSTGNIFGNNTKLSSIDATKTNGFSFGLKTDSKATAPSSSTTSSSTLAGFSFGKPISSSTDSTDEKKPAATGFSFTPGATPFTFGNIQPPSAMPTSTSNADEEDEEDQPPKVEFKQVVEDDAVFSKKCKVFVKKDGNFADRGVGTVFLKPVKDSEKTQLLVRADTNLGNILVNLILSEGIPAQRMGKNNVMLVCVPTPDVAKPTPMLLRVKTGEEADELLEAIEKYKK